MDVVVLHSFAASTMESMKTFLQRAAHLKYGESVYAIIPVTIAEVYLVDDAKLAYPACPDDTCRARMNNVLTIPTKKVWKCSKCGKQEQKPKMRYHVRVTLGDVNTGIHEEQDFIAWDGVGEDLLGISAPALLKKRVRWHVAMKILDRVMFLGVAASRRKNHPMNWTIVNIVKAPVRQAPPPVECQPSYAKDILYMGED